MILRVFACLLGLAIFVAPGAAEPTPVAPSVSGLEFEAREISLVAAPGVEQLEAEFVFVNRADRTVFVGEVTAACGCTVPSLEKTNYAPGEEGKLRAVFSVGGRQGPQLLSIKVRTDAGEHDLVLKVDIPSRFTLLPRLLWFRGGEVEAKTARMTYHTGTPVTLLEPRNLSDAFTVTVREIEAGREFEFTVTYIGHATQVHSAFYELRSRDSGGREHSDRLYLRHAP